jgi:hypothetical protein
MHTPQIDRLIKRSINFCWGSDVDDTPEEPGVYAWFLPFRSSDFTDLPRLFESARSNLESKAALTRVGGKIGASFIEFQQAVPAKEDLRPLSVPENPLSRSQMEQIGDFLLAFSILSPPIYVGMAAGERGLRQRLKQHVSGNFVIAQDDPYLGSFAARVTHIINDPRYLPQCIVAYASLNNLPEKAIASRWLEHFLINQVNPNLSIRD